MADLPDTVEEAASLLVSIDLATAHGQELAHSCLVEYRRRDFVALLSAIRQQGPITSNLARTLLDFYDPKNARFNYEEQSAPSALAAFGPVLIKEAAMKLSQNKYNVAARGFRILQEVGLAAAEYIPIVES